MEVDGKVFGLTSHLVPFPVHSEPFPTSHERSMKASYSLWQPSEHDHERKIWYLKQDQKHFECHNPWEEITNHKAEEILTVNKKLQRLERWTQDLCRLGKVWRSSGLRNRGVNDDELNFGLDWALIELENPARFTTGEEAAFVNKVRLYQTY